MFPGVSLYSWVTSLYNLVSLKGANSHGQLGHGDIEDDELLLPRKIDITSSSLDVDGVAKIVGGAGHTLLLSRDGRLFGCGWNSKGQLGLTASSSRFQELEALGCEKVVDVACGWDSSMALTEQGDVFVWGSNSHGQLGLAGTDKICEPRKLAGEVSGRKVKRISMGLRHSAIISTEGELLVSGASSKGQLGVDLRGARQSETFVKVPDLPPVREIACGQHHSVVITQDDELFAWGDNKHGQLGINPGEWKIAMTPRKVENGSVVDRTSKIYCGWTHTCLHSSAVYSWGRNSYGQLGRPTETSATDCWKADVVVLKDGVRSLSVGSEHNIALSANGAVFTWGWNEHGNCGTGSAQDVVIPAEIKLPGTRLIGAGAGHSFALVRYG